MRKSIALRATFGAAMLVASASASAATSTSAATTTVNVRPKVVAHRGHWQEAGSAQNSLRSLAKADSIGAFASEFDVWRSADGHLFCNHDKTFKGVTIADASSKVIAAVDLDNGERLPTLHDMLSEALAHPGLRLVLELKEHDNKEAEASAAEETVAMVEQLGLTPRTDYITFSKHALRHYAAIAPEGCDVYYLTGDLTPAQVHAVGADGIDYHISEFRRNPQWIDEAHKLGMKVNVWTVDAPEDIQWCIDNGVDLITTNRPTLAAEMIAASR